MAGKCYPFLGKFHITSLFGKRNSQEGAISSYHKGIDLVADGNKDVVSCTNGTVKIVKTSADGSGLGNRVWVENEDGTVCIYCHLKDGSMVVKEGQSITCKDKIGVMGYSGNTYPKGVHGAHLHFGISTSKDYNYNTSKWINPVDWFGMKRGKNKSLTDMQFDGSGMLVASDAVKVDRKEEIDDIYKNELVSNQYFKINEMSGVVKDVIYGRRYRVIVDLGEENAFDVSELRCQFECYYSLVKEINMSKITIYNLNIDDENRIIKNGVRIIIEAGYAGSQYGKIYEGNILQVVRSKENGVDFKITILSLDSERFVAYGLVGFTINRGSTARSAIEEIVNRAGDINETNYSQEIGMITDTNIVYPRGKVLFGKATNILDNIAKSLNATYYNEDGKVNIVGSEDLDDNEIFYLSPESGLVGYPEQTETGISFSCLLNPVLKLNSLVHIDNTVIKEREYTYGNNVRSLDNEGIYRIIKIVHVGDTRGNNESWLTNVDAVSQVGSLPGIVANPASYSGL